MDLDTDLALETDLDFTEDRFDRAEVGREGGLLDEDSRLCFFDAEELSAELDLDLFPFSSSFRCFSSSFFKICL